MRPYTKEYILYDTIYMKVSKTIYVGKKSEYWYFLRAWKYGLTGMGHKGILGGNNNALSFDRGLVYTDVCAC